jgi:hypothetical protein
LVLAVGKLSREVELPLDETDWTDLQLELLPDGADVLEEDVDNGQPGVSVEKMVIGATKSV